MPKQIKITISSQGYPQVKFKGAVTQSEIETGLEILTSYKKLKPVQKHYSPENRPSKIDVEV